MLDVSAFMPQANMLKHKDICGMILTYALGNHDKACNDRAEVVVVVVAAEVAAVAAVVAVVAVVASSCGRRRRRSVVLSLRSSRSNTSGALTMNSKP